MGLVIGAAFSAGASHGKDGDPISEVPNLFADGATYGTITNHNDSTENNNLEHGHCYTFDLEGGGSVYEFTAKIGTRVQLDVTDDIGGESLCAVEIFRQHLGENTLPALYGYPEVHDHQVALSTCPEENSVCREKWVMPEDDTYYLAFWPQGTEELNYSTFRFSTSIRQPTKTKLSIDGASKPPASRCYVVRKGRSITANTRVTRNATGTVEFRLERKQKRNWKLIGTDDVALVGSKASLDQRFGQAGKYRLGADYLGDDTRAPSESKAHCFEVTG